MAEPLQPLLAGGMWHLFTQVPPLHPILVNLTAGLIPAAVGFDVLGRLTRRESLASAGYWMTLLAAGVTPFTALAGWLWMDEMGHGGEAMAVHKWLGTALAVLLLGLAGWRWFEHRLATRPGARPAYLGVATLFVFLLVAQGHIGGMMSFGTGGGHDEHGGEAHAVDETLTDLSEDDGWRRGIPVNDAPKSHEDGDDHAH